MVLSLLTAFALIFPLSVLLPACGKKGASKDTNGGSKMKPPPAPSPAAAAPKADEKKPAAAEKSEDKKDDPKSKTESKKVEDKKAGASTKSNKKGEKSAQPGDDGGYEACPDMTPEELAKIADQK